MFRNSSLRTKIAFAVVGYVVLIGVIGNIFLFIYLEDMVQKKAERLDSAYIKSVRTQMQRSFENVFSLAVVCAKDPEILQLISRKNLTEHETIMDSLNIQSQMNTLLHSSPVNSYINKLILFNNQGMFIQAQGRLLGEPTDRERIYQQQIYTRLMADNLPWISGFDKSLSAMNRQDCCIIAFRVTNYLRSGPEAFLYLEAGIDIITDVLRDYEAPPGVFVYIPDTGKAVLQNSPHFIQPEEGKPGYIPADAEFPFRFRQDGRSYRLDRMPLENDMLVIYNQADVTNLAVDDERILYIVLSTVLLSLLAAVGLTVVLSMFFTIPIHTLINRIQKITMENDFTFDPEIEKRGDEIGQIGHAINEMSGSIGHFLVEMEKQYRQQKNTEIALLQTQINPHFLYNTLDSIQWMAKIQNNHAISGIIGRFTSLLRNIVSRTDSAGVYGSGGKIPIAEELLIIEDYTELMSLRFLGNFEVNNKIPQNFSDCLIPKFTLQPLVENAIIHGIRPSGKFGSITLNASCENEFLDITVEDSGLGMSPEQIELIKTAKREKKRENPSLNNIGIANVEERLKLLYGNSCGLSYKSQPGKGTKVTIRIKLER